MEFIAKGFLCFSYKPCQQPMLSQGKVNLNFLEGDNPSRIGKRVLHCLQQISVLQKRENRFFDNYSLQI